MSTQVHSAHIRPNSARCLKRLTVIIKDSKSTVWKHIIPVLDNEEKDFLMLVPDFALLEEIEIEKTQIDFLT